MSRWGWFGVRLLVGCAASLGAVSILTIGIFVLPIAGAAILLLVVTRRQSIDGVAERNRARRRSRFGVV